MGHQIIKQPNDLFAVFCNNTDSWIFADATSEELLDYYAERAAEEARKRTQEILNHVDAGEPRRAYYQFAMTFKEANAEHNRRHPKAFKKGEFIGFPDGDDE